MFVAMRSGEGAGSDRSDDCKPSLQYDVLGLRSEGGLGYEHSFCSSSHSPFIFILQKINIAAVLQFSTTS